MYQTISVQPWSREWVSNYDTEHKKIKGEKKQDYINLQTSAHQSTKKETEDKLSVACVTENIKQNISTPTYPKGKRQQCNRKWKGAGPTKGKT